MERSREWSEGEALGNRRSGPGLSILSGISGAARPTSVLHVPTSPPGLTLAVTLVRLALRLTPAPHAGRAVGVVTPAPHAGRAVGVVSKHGRKEDGVILNHSTSWSFL